MCCPFIRVLEHFNTTAEDYDLIFTSGATAALRLVAEHFNWKAEVTPPSADLTALSNSAEDTPEHSIGAQHSTQHHEQDHHHHHSKDEEEESSPGAFVYLQENHTSVLGMRGPAHQASCDIFCLTAPEARDWLGEAPGSPNSSAAGKASNLSIPGCEDVLLSCVESAAKANQLPIPGCGDSSTGHAESMAKANCLSIPGCGDLSTVCSESTAKANHLSIPGDLLSCHPKSAAKPRGKIKRRNCLFAYSGQCNFSGSKAPLEWIRQVQEGALDGLLSTTPINRENAQRRKDSGK